MSNRIENVETKNAPSWVLDIMSQYFVNKNRLTVGTMVRKLPYMLIELAAYNDKPWYLTCKYDTKSGGRFITRITCPEDAVRIVDNGRTIGGSTIALTAINLVSAGALYDNTVAVLEQTFQSRISNQSEREAVPLYLTETQAQNMTCASRFDNI